MIFWDSSAVIHLIIDQGKSAQALKLLEEDPDILVWWATPSECAAALARLERESKIDAQFVTKALLKIRELKSSWIEVLPSEEVRELSYQLPRRHTLRSGDALQLAAALIGFGSQTTRKQFYSYDERLCIAAQREGHEIIG